MPNTHSTLTSLFSDIADAIRGKTGSSATIVADDFPTAIASIPTGGGSATIEPLSVTANGTYTAPSGVDGYSPVVVNVPSSGGGGSASDAVRFLDYDGTVLYTYSDTDFANLTAMPANPTHTGLTAQGWNWTLANAKTYVATYGMLDIGQMYVTDDGTTRVYISLIDSARLSPYLGICPNGTVVVDWGDGTATDTLTGTSLYAVQRAQHTYASVGDYIITLTVLSGKFAIYGSGSSSTSSNGSYLLTRTNGDIVSQRCYQSAIQKVELGTNVSVGGNAFFACYSLTNITLPSSVTSIGANAFYNCYSLTNITIPSGVTSIGTYTFGYCYSLTSITLPSSVTLIGANAFYDCYSLTNITIPSGVTSIGEDTFESCNSLTNITIPSSVKSIGRYAFESCNSLTNITIPSGVASIKDYTFSKCCSLTSITLPNSVTSIGANAFYNCYSLTNITIPSGVTSIGNSAFGYCNSLTSITLPNSVTSIGTYAFQRCSSLTSITISSGITSISAHLFEYCSFKDITIPSSVTSIGESAFAYCYSLTNITIPSGVTSIGANAFYYCYSLRSITIPSNVTSINNATFYCCYPLASITIPSGITSISASAFRDCYGVAEYHFLPTTPPTLANTNVFSGILSDCKIYVPAASLSAYQTATNWSTYASKMVGE